MVAAQYIFMIIAIINKKVIKRIENKIMFGLLLLLSISPAKGQEKFVYGKVTAFNSMLIENAEISSKKGKVSVFTDSLGRFSIERFKKDKLLFNAPGFKSQSIKINEESDSISVNLVFGGTEKDKQVAIGGGYMNAEDLTVAIDQYNLDENSNASYSNIIELMKAKYAQIQFVGREIRIRGGKSVNSSNAALIIVNEFATDYSYLEGIVASDVKSISVLKGAAASVYGSRGANGVVIVTLKNANTK